MEREGKGMEREGEVKEMEKAKGRLREGRGTKRERKERGGGFAGPMSNCFLRACYVYSTLFAKGAARGGYVTSIGWRV